MCAACGTVWSRSEGVSVQQVVMWWACVGIIWAAVKEFKCLLYKNHSLFSWRIFGILVIYDVNENINTADYSKLPLSPLPKARY